MSGNSFVKVGDRAPSFSLPDRDGNPVNLDDFLGEKPIVLFFYPKDDTPGCIAESCAFRDSHAIFQEMGAEVIGLVQIRRPPIDDLLLNISSLLPS